MIEKIISRNVGVDSVKPGQIQTVNVDRVMIHDSKKWDLQSYGIQTKLY